MFQITLTNFPWFDSVFDFLFLTYLLWEYFYVSTFFQNFRMLLLGIYCPILEYQYSEAGDSYLFYYEAQEILSFFIPSFDFF